MNWHIPNAARSVFEEPTPLSPPSAKHPFPCSVEGIVHHLLSHGCGGRPSRLVCDCGTTYVLFCKKCGEALFLLVEPGTWCEHAAEMWEGQA